MEYDILLNIDDIVNGPEVMGDESRRFSNYEKPEWIEQERSSLIQGQLSKDSSVAAGIIRGLQARSGIEDGLVSKAASKLYSFLELLGDRIDIQRKVLSLGHTTDESIVVDFAPEQNMRLVIYYNDDADEDEDVEEAFLDYEHNGKYYLVNNTLYQISEKLKELLP